MKFYLNAKSKINEEVVASAFNKFGEVVSNVADCDLIVSVGGDGTFLKAGKVAVKYDNQILGINAGNLGYLCAFKIEDIDKIGLDDIKKLHITERTLIEYKDNIAINDICVLKENPVNSIEVSYKNMKWKGDGIIVSTATGSSSYNESAGGPILDPISKDLIVTPVCPHFSKYPYQVVKDEIIELNVCDNNPAIITCDNIVLGNIEGKVIIKKSNKTLKILNH